MILIEELVKKISDIFNGLDDETSSVFNPATSFDFKVASYGTHLDKIANKNTKKNVIPIYISNFNGTIEPIPHLKEENISYDCYIYFPIQYKTTFFKLTNFIIDCFTGKILNFGSESGSAVTNLNAPTLTDLQQVDMVQFGDFLNENFGLPISRTGLWGVMEFTLFCHQVDNLGKANGFIIGNQVSHSMSFTYDNQTYNEDLVVVSSARNLNADTISEQKINALQTCGIAKNTSYIDSVQAYARDNEFWRKFIYLYETGKLQNMVFDYSKTYNLSARLTFNKKAYLSQCPTSDDLGQTKTFTFTFIKPISETDQDTSVIETKLRIPQTIASSYFEDFNVNLIPTLGQRIAIMEFKPWLEDATSEQNATMQDYGYLDIPTTNAYAKWSDFGRLNEAPTYNVDAIYEDFGFLETITSTESATMQDYGYLDNIGASLMAIYQDYGYLDTSTTTQNALFENFNFTDIPTTKASAIYQTEGNLDVPTLKQQATYQQYHLANAPIISNISIQDTQIVDNQITLDSTSWNSDQAQLVSTLREYDATQFEGVQNLTPTKVKIRTGIEVDANQDVHLHFFTRKKIDVITSENWQGYMYGRQAPSTTFNDGLATKEPNVTKVYYKRLNNGGFRLAMANASSVVQTNEMNVKSVKAYLVEKQDVAPSINFLYYDVNLGQSQNIKNAVGIYGLGNLNTMNAFKGDFTLFNNGEYV